MSTRSAFLRPWILAPLVLLACGGSGSRQSQPPAPASDPAYQFEAKPYLQMGNNPTAADRLTRVWQALDEAAVWGVEIQVQPGGSWLPMAPPESSLVAVSGTGYRVWTSILQPLQPGGAFSYRVLRNGKEVFLQTGPGPAKGRARPSASPWWRIWWTVMAPRDWRWLARSRSRSRICWWRWGTWSTTGARSGSTGPGSSPPTTGTRRIPPRARPSCAARSWWACWATMIPSTTPGIGTWPRSGQTLQK